MANDFGTFLFGDSDTKTKLQNQITQLQTQLSSMGANDPNRQALITKLGNLKAQLQQEMANQGATDQYGRLLSARDVQDQYLNKDYLNMVKQQGADTEANALATGLKQAKQNQLQGAGGGVRDVMGKVAEIQRTNQNQLANTVYNEQNRALNEASGELARKSNYATQLTSTDRQAALDQLNAQLQDFQLSATQLQLLQNQLNSMDDGLVQQLLAGGANLLGQWVGSKLGL